MKKIWYSITKLEKYTEMATEGVMKALKYLAILMIVLSCISSLGSLYSTNNEVKYIVNYIDENAPDFSYSDGKLSLISEEVVRLEDEELGKIIIDTSEGDDVESKYTEELENCEDYIIILREEVIISRESYTEDVTYTYKDILEQMGITEFDKQSLVENINTSSMMPIYANLFVTLFIYAFVIYYINTLINIIAISVFGFITSLILRLKLKYSAIFNMAVYSITLSVILEMIYIGINAFVDYTITYFNLMYILVASIYMIASMFILKSDFTKKQEEVQKIVEVEKKVKEDLKEQEEQEQKNKENKENKENKDNNKEDNNSEKKKKTKEEEIPPEGEGA